jgi:hypothetical protein
MLTQRQLLNSYSRLSSSLVQNTGKQAADMFRNLTDWNDGSFVRFSKAVSTMSAAAAMKATQLQLAYDREVAKANQEIYVTPVIPASSYRTEALRNGATEAAVYRRPFAEVYIGLAAGKTLEEAVEAGARRIGSIVSSNIQIAKRNAAAESSRRQGNVVGFARVLTGNESCALCYVASTRLYKRGDLLPIHPGCDCGIRQVYRSEATGEVLDSVRLESVEEVITNEFGSPESTWDLSKITIRQHGELGDVLTVADNDYTTENDVPDRWWQGEDRRARRTTRRVRR